MEVAHVELVLRDVALLLPSFSLNVSSRVCGQQTASSSSVDVVLAVLFVEELLPALMLLKRLRKQIFFKIH